MKRPNPSQDWPESWKVSYRYDCMEVFGDESAPGYTHAYRNRFATTLRLVREVVPAGGRVLDVAAAQGNFTLAMAELGYRVTWNDIREDLPRYVELKRESGHVEFKPGNVLETTFDEPFDAVLATEVLEHVSRPDRFLAALARLVKPGGHVILTTPNGAYFRSGLPRFSEHSNPDVFRDREFKPDADGHIFLLWPDELRALSAAAGLHVRKQIFFTNPLTNGHLKSARLLRILPEAFVTRIEALSLRLPSRILERLMVGTAVVLAKPPATADQPRTETR